ncbi:glycine betaine/carnitine/choline ABC transporter permease [Enterococcus haemoperoxidus ATCC BAA-382]|uniref:Glycine betaine/carnitine/choline ABC transporter permease n=3 Tax=Enterococcus TaxID=1350 RepID=R2T1A6_9ENTE|nr:MULTISPECIES: ABC transporter permease [Enterococcus]EOH94024.1 glycine betaine/carnitine/choline ABC transporter permease [Enterococcus haemoperoxidus ATCC BAA-382]EOL47684.1 glycine betaine/carnitine/choline ABC transporter permease [Enterococcus caccae ATCC BAA-1240]EOT63332.1 glycine betaine/carnitine/choline ABC transporter permease [Enterococcus haemoperoxidus ATCC BAA-382]EOT65482.1 glycine betaine/carnitine/choline ABC transporter permease [Enterococcus caccae ATCC BAA-1240]OJG27339
MNQFLLERGNELVTKIGEHIFISGVALLLGILFAVPIGILLTRTKRTAAIVIGLTSALQTVPSLALLALMIPIFGVGKIPAIIALFIYSLLPILRNTYIGIKEVSSDYKDAAKGMGMTNVQSIFMVELPIAMPTIMAGIRLAAVYVIAWATLASYIGAGGLGDFIFSGLNNYQPDLIFAGTIPVTILALAADLLLGLLEKKLTPKALKEAE